MRFTIRIKLMLGYAAILCLMLSASILGYLALDNVSKTAGKILVQAHKYDIINGLMESVKLFLDINDVLIKDPIHDTRYYESLSDDVGKKIFYASKLGLNDTKKKFLENVENEFNFIRKSTKSSLVWTYTERSANLIQLLKDTDRAKLDLYNNIDALYNEAWRNLDNVVIEAAHVKEMALQQIIIVSIITIIIGIGISVYTAHSITAPIGALSHAADSVAKGGDYSEVRKTTKDEIGGLVESFNQMALDLKISRGQIEKYNKELQAMVDERTAELEKTKEYLENILEYSGDMIVTTTLYDEIVQFNRGAENILGCIRENMVGINFEDMFVDKRDYKRIRERAVDYGNVSNYDTRLMKKSGDIVRISLTISRLKDRKGTIIGLVFIGKDITKKEEGLNI
jgi:PAS domain S-box-containing protein